MFLKSMFIETDLIRSEAFYLGLGEGLYILLCSEPTYGYLFACTHIC